VVGVITDTERDRLFFASCVALVATAMTFAIRADTLQALRQTFFLTQTQIGWVAGTAFWGFTVAMLIGGQLCDSVGMGRLVAVAFGMHLSGILLTIFSVGFWSLYSGTLLIGLANGLVESVLNPLIPTIYPDHKTEKLNALHTWFPGGIVIGGLAAAGMTRLHWNWQIKTASILIPTVAYGALFLKRKFPLTERKESQVTTAAMYREALRPTFLVLLFCMLLTAAAELGPEQWIPSILIRTAHAPGTLVLVWITGLEALGRRSASTFVRRVSPIAMLILSASIGGVGLLALSEARSAYVAFAAGGLFAIGICYCWPTMYGVTSERFPAGGAFLLAVMGSAGMLSDAIIVPVIGAIYDSKGPRVALLDMAFVPWVAAAILSVIWLRDLRRGGYKVVRLRVQGESVSTNVH
jgi:fucose permease